MNRVSIAKIGLLTIAVFVLFLFVPAMAGAQDRPLVPCGPGTDIDCELCHLFEMAGRIFNLVVWRIVPSIATIMIIVAGIRFFTALGNPGELEKIKKMFIGIFAGFLLIVLAWSITVLLYRVMGAGGPVGWWNIPGCP